MSDPGQFPTSFLWYHSTASMNSDFLSGYSALATGAWPSANLAQYVPFTLPWPFTVKRMFWTNGAATLTNMNVGVYTSGGSLIYASGSIAQSGVNTVQFATPTTPFLLNPGSYYFAAVNSSTSDVFMATTTNAIDARLSGCLQEQLGSITLPASMTPTAFSGSAIVQMGITQT